MKHVNNGNSIVEGGGCFEKKISNHLENFANSIKQNEPEKIAIVAAIKTFAKSLLVIPSTLTKNRINIGNRDYGNAYEDSNDSKFEETNHSIDVIDLVKSKTNILTMTTQTIINLLTTTLDLPDLKHTTNSTMIYDKKTILKFENLNSSPKNNINQTRSLGIARHSLLNAKIPKYKSLTIPSTHQLPLQYKKPNSLVSGANGLIKKEQKPDSLVSEANELIKKEETSAQINDDNLISQNIINDISKNTINVIKEEPTPSKMTTNETLQSTNQITEETQNTAKIPTNSSVAQPMNQKQVESIKVNMVDSNNKLDVQSKSIKRKDDGKQLSPKQSPKKIKKEYSDANADADADEEANADADADADADAEGNAHADADDGNNSNQQTSSLVNNFCYICKNMFYDKSTLNRHMKLKHNENITKNNNKQNSQSYENNEKDLKQRICSTCGKSFHDKSTLNRHMKSRHNTKQ